ncbi:Uncharacterised protein [Vibrio cholerae]|nr:Uncharacterised protein [Vibrio cholerae]CRZ67610.1 Uncharacterised protein [Vibrio cholerae]CRZ72148.1 Uncharacterised protein [Vibrio cholerae]CRZ73243.1 Uncharacterised protein [Vibrio cholerae]CRZ75698.1 Uncharacterised protein [Vibrio cholerae]
MVDHAFVFTVVEAHIIKRNATMLNHQGFRVRFVGDGDGFAKHGHAIDNGTDVFKQGADFPHDPLRHAVDTQG